jgi:hypothetical protein
MTESSSRHAARKPSITASFTLTLDNTDASCHGYTEDALRGGVPQRRERVHPNTAAPAARGYIVWFAIRESPRRLFHRGQGRMMKSVERAGPPAV